MILTIIFFSLFFGILGLLLIPQHKIQTIKLISLSLTGFVFLLASSILATFNSNKSTFQFFTDLTSISSHVLNIDFSYGIDGISIYFFF